MRGISDEKVVHRETFLVHKKMNSKLFAFCVILVVASVISLSQGSPVNTHHDKIDDLTMSAQSDSQLVRHRRDILCDETKCNLECITK
ncbi:hypothetical protein Bhyg_08963, partial [Pseudolycoriella hygida]